MPGIIERIGSLAGTELAKAVNLAHTTYQERMAVHNHTGRAVIESAVEVCRNHPNLVGIGAGLLVEQLLVEERHRHEAHVKAEAAGDQLHIGPSPAASPRKRGDAKRPRPHAPDTHGRQAHLPNVKLHAIKPGRIALEVFGALLLLKIGAAGARMFRRKHQADVWFAPAARVHLFSATIAAYNLAGAIRSPRVSAWRNGAVAFFGTDAIKPLLEARPTRLAVATAPDGPPAQALAPQVPPPQPPGLQAPEPQPVEPQSPEPPAVAPEAPAASPDAPAPPRTSAVPTLTVVGSPVA
jgi:hypothetical protein